MQVTFDITRRPPGGLPPSEEGEKVGVTRRRARELLTARGLSHVADQAVLILSELVTNAIVHSGGARITVALSLRAGSLRIDVHDGVPNFQPSQAQPAGDNDEHGRGLALVQILTAETHGNWGVEDGGATTWCELKLAAS
ncbi:ATP-binding protein [Streptomyces cyaneofuscatus]|uniref:ATP-binding protein n=1 Tax=Streptomyces cyaneofuscatus TaxID=66883 RepID=UPI0036466208